MLDGAWAGARRTDVEERVVRRGSREAAELDLAEKLKNQSRFREIRLVILRSTVGMDHFADEASPVHEEPKDEDGDDDELLFPVRSSPPAPVDDDEDEDSDEVLRPAKKKVKVRAPPASSADACSDESAARTSSSTSRRTWTRTTRTTTRRRRASSRMVRPAPRSLDPCSRSSRRLYRA